MGNSPPAPKFGGEMACVSGLSPESGFRGGEAGVAACQKAPLAGSYRLQLYSRGNKVAVCKCGYQRENTIKSQESDLCFALSRWKPLPCPPLKESGDGGRNLSAPRRGEGRGMQGVRQSEVARP